MFDKNKTEIEDRTATLISTNRIELPKAPPKTKLWDPSKMITTGNVDKVRVELNKPIPMQPIKRGRKPKE